MSKLGNYNLIRKLAEGKRYNSIWIGESEEKKYAIKETDVGERVPKEEQERLIRKSLEEFNILKGIRNSGIIRVHEWGRGEIIEEGKSREVVYIVEELGSEGDLFEYIQNGAGKIRNNGDKEHMHQYKTPREYALQILQILTYLHSENIAHMDLKPQNFLLDNELNLKLCDFDLSIRVRESDMCTAPLGTPRYMPPECIGLPHAYYPYQVEMFTFGVLIFNLIFAAHPYSLTASLTDPLYRLFVQNNLQFWNLWEKYIKEKIDQDLILVINDLMEHDPERRATLEEISQYYWFTGEN